MPIIQNKFSSPITGGPPSQPPSQEIGQEEFLSLLMTQMSNQDPLNPMETEQFMAQITQMNALQQQIDMNDKLDQLVLAMGSLANENAVGLVGQEVVAAGNTFTHQEGASEDLAFDLPRQAEAVTVTVYDENGNQIRVIKGGERLEGLGRVTWDGLDDEGNPAPEGTYTFQVGATDANDAIIDGVTEVISGTVTELRFDDGSPVLFVDGEEVPLPDVIRVLAGIGEDDEDLPSQTMSPSTSAVNTLNATQNYSSAMNAADGSTLPTATDGTPIATDS